MSHRAPLIVGLGVLGVGCAVAACTYEPPTAANTGGAGGTGAAGSVSSSGSVGSGGDAGVGGAGGSVGTSSSSGAAGAGGGLATDWWHQDWKHRVRISFKNAGGEHLTDFPVMVRLNDSVVKGISTLATAADIRFVDAYGKTSLPLEIEAWNSGGESIVWVNVPSIDTTDADYMWLYFGNPAAMPEQTQQAVWKGFARVYHMSQVSPIVESAAAKSGTWMGTPTNVVSGILHDAIQFNGVSYLQLEENSIGNVAVDQARTIEAWAHPDMSNQHQAIVWQEGQCVGWSLKTNFAGQFEGRFITDQVPPICSAGTVEPFVVSPFTVGGWHYLALVIDRAKGAMTLHVDGLAKESVVVDNFGISDGNGYLQIGSNYTGATFFGAIDEVRISDSARTSGWIAAQHTSMTGAFLGFGVVDNL